MYRLYNVQISQCTGQSVYSSCHVQVTVYRSCSVQLMPCIGHIVYRSVSVQVGQYTGQSVYNSCPVQDQGAARRDPDPSRHPADGQWVVHLYSHQPPRLRHCRIQPHRPRSVDDPVRSVDDLSGQCTTLLGQWTTMLGQWTTLLGQWTTLSGHWTNLSGQYTTCQVSV